MNTINLKTFMVLLCVLSLLNTDIASAANITIRDRVLYLSGPIESGDAERISMLLSQHPINKDLDMVYEANLNSYGGSLIEGITIGLLFREKELITRVSKGNSCLSACAVAFLGGTVRGASSSAARKILEPGADLGFHGYKFKSDKLAINNETLEISRVLNALVIQYALQIGEMDIALLHELLSIPFSEIKIINTPKYLGGLGIRIDGNLPKPPKNWARNACTNEVNKARPIKDGYSLNDRIPPGGATSTLVNSPQLKKSLIDDLFPKGNSKRPVLLKLSDLDFLDLILQVEPKFPVQRFEFKRGAGFFWDACYSFETESDGVYIVS